MGMEDGLWDSKELRKTRVQRVGSKSCLRGQHEAGFCATPRHGVVLAGAQNKPKSSQGALSQQQGQGVQLLDSVVGGSMQ